jgi:hypothetical protein
MNKIFVVACAVSAAALASSALAVPPPAPDSTYNTTIEGDVPAYCYIAPTTTPPTVTPTGAATFGGSLSGGGIITLASLAGADGIVKAVDIAESLTVKANGTCTAKLSSENAGLANENHPSAAVIKYQAKLGVNTLEDVKTTEFSSSPITFDTSLSHSLAYDISIPVGTAPVAAGHYKDILRINLYAAV